jgi:mannose-6-phosphate isomerase
MTPLPLKFKPLYKERIWGGTALKDVFGKDIPEGARIGESWELADLPHDQSVIMNGELAGLTLAEAVRRAGRTITGRDDLSSPFPLLVKLLDCADRLSLQVHPDPDACRRLGRGDFKTECWYIIKSRPEAFICKGLVPGVTREMFERAIAAGNVERLLNKVPVREGECHFLPAGTLHTIGAGILIAEIQTPSDTTYRVFDWNRLDDEGRARPLHVTEALESIHFDASRDYLSVHNTGRIASCPYFSVDKHTLPAGAAVFKAGRMAVIIILSGRGDFSGEEGPVSARPGDTVLVPAAYSGTLTVSTGPVDYLSISI